MTSTAIMPMRWGVPSASRLIDIQPENAWMTESVTGSLLYGPSWPKPVTER